jgi:hypothetical protein
LGERAEAQRQRLNRQPAREGEIRKRDGLVVGFEIVAELIRVFHAGGKAKAEVHVERPAPDLSKASRIGVERAGIARGGHIGAGEQIGFDTEADQIEAVAGETAPVRQSERQARAA